MNESIDIDFCSSNLVFIENKMLGIFLDIEETVFEKNLGWESLFVPLFVHSEYVPGISVKMIKDNNIFDNIKGLKFFNDCEKLNHISDEQGEFIFENSRAIMFELEMEDIFAKTI